MLQVDEDPPIFSKEGMRSLFQGSPKERTDTKADNLWIRTREEIWARACETEGGMGGLGP